MTRRTGSAAAVPARAWTAPQSAVRVALLRSVASIATCARLTRGAPSSAEPELAAHHVLDLLQDLLLDETALRTALGRPRPRARSRAIR